jgi:vitamin B12 transporter
MKTVIFQARLAVLPCVLSLAFPVVAQTAPSTTLKDVVVTATRTETLANAIMSDVTVITRDDIERGTGRTVTELIARVAGVQAASNGGLGKNSSIFVRGTESRHVLLLVDGVRLGSSTAGTPNFDTIALETIERIEVLKGPASALYGSDAVGGVVQIFTRKGSAGLHPYASVTVGEGDRGELSTGLTGGTSDLSYAVGVQTLSEKGFSSTNPRVAFGSFNPDRDGFSQTSANASVGWKLTEGWKVDARAFQSDGISQFDNGAGDFDARSEFASSVYGLGLNGRIMPHWRSRLSLGSSKDNANSFTSATPSAFNTAQDQWTWQNDIDTPLGTLVAGFDSLKETVSGSTAYTVASRTTDSWFAGLNGSAGEHSWQVNARQDHNSQFGDANTGLLGYGYRWTPALRVHASVGTSFKVPSFNTLYYPGYSNPTTQPETGRNAEVGATYTVGSQQFSVTRFANRIQGFITTAPVVTNVPFARIEGWTLAYDGDWEGLDYRAALNLLDASNESTGKKLARRPDTQLTANVGYALGAWNLGASLLAASEAFDNAANTQTMGGYATMDLYARYKLEKAWSVEGRLVNLADKFYQTAMGYNQPGRSAYLTVRYQPQ